MIRKSGRIEYGDVTIIVDSDDVMLGEAQESVRSLLGDDYQSVNEFPFRSRSDFRLFMEMDSKTMPKDIVIWNPESLIRPGEAKAFVMRLGNLAMAAGKRSIVFTHDYFVFSYAALMAKYHVRFWPDYANIDWRFNYGFLESGGEISVHDHLFDEPFLSDTSIGIAFDEVYNLELKCVFGDDLEE